eukprot:GEMP01002189.1.p1 GENE.GEMP01002189.1~~GEMP01002189.1.p1  ORF type:complete len:788 (-),score=149.94 GEMP01002189.1:2576-4939(-)
MISSTAAPFFDKASAALGGLTDALGTLTTSETQFFDEERYNESELRKNLNNSAMEKKLDAMKRVLAAVSYGRDCGPLFPEVVKNVATPNLELKKLVYIYLVLYGEQNTDLALLAINTFQKDLADRSQVVRAAALRAMASFKMMEIVQFILLALKKAAADQSSYVRKTAAHCAVKVYSLDQDQYQELLPVVLKLMNDSEVSVIAGAIVAFHYLCIAHPPIHEVDLLGEAPNSDGQEQLALLHPHFRRLCDVILQIDSWSQTYALDILVRYGRVFFTNPNTPQEGEGSEDFKTLLHTLVSLLSCSSSSTVVSAAVALTNLAPAEEIPQTVEPLLRTLQVSSDECAQAVLRAILPLIQADADKWRPYIRDFFVRSVDIPETKELKLETLVLLCDDTNAQMVMKELQVYVRWHSSPTFVVAAVRSIAQIGLKVSSVAEQCLRGLVKMLDSKCSALASEAVVGVRTLLQRQRHESNDDKLTQVCAQLVRYLDDLKAPGARASVVWILGEYQRDIPFLAPDALRKLAKQMPSETPEVKHQILIFGLKVWAFHALNRAEDSSNSSFDPEESRKILPRLEAIFDHICKVASYDSEIDVRDMARNIAAMKNATMAAMNNENVDPDLAAFCAAYGELSKKSPGAEQLLPPPKRNIEEAKHNARYILSSMAHLLSVPFSTYRTLPAWAEECSEDSLRNPVEPPRQEVAPTNMSSADCHGHSNHAQLAARVQEPSNITAMPQVVESLEQLDLFYAEEEPSAATATNANQGGCAVAGEDSESSVDDNDEDWDKIKKCLLK